MAEKQYYPELDRLRGIAILMVLLYHSILVYPIDLTAQPFYGTLHSFLFMVEMPLFFLVAGFCFRYEGQFGAYLKKKSLRILVPHIVFGLMDITLRLLPGGLVHERLDINGALRELFLYGANDWFLWTLFLIFFAAPLLARIMNRGKAGKAAVIIVALALYLMQNKVPYLLCLRNVVQFLIFFVLGMSGATARETKKGAQIARLWHAPVCAVLGILFFLLQYWKGWLHDEAAWENALFGLLKPLKAPLTVEILPGITWLKWCNLLVNLAAPLFLCYALYLLARRLREGRAERFLKLCSRYSLQMYLLDGYALVLTRTLLVSVCGITAGWLIVPANFILDTAIVLLISRYILDRWAFLRVLSGLNRRS